MKIMICVGFLFAVIAAAVMTGLEFFGDLFLANDEQLARVMDFLVWCIILSLLLSTGSGAYTVFHH